MKDAPWAVIVDGTGNVTERKLADQSPGDLLAPSVRVQSSSVSGGTRTVVLTRALKGASKKYFTFDPAAGASVATTPRPQCLAWPTPVAPPPLPPCTSCCPWRAPGTARRPAARFLA